MAHVGTLKHYRFDSSVDDVRGANLYGGGNEKLGKVDDVIFDHDSGRVGYLVVDAGGWFQARRFLVPADRINPRGEGRDFTSDLTKDQISVFPDYNDEDVRADRWSDYERHFHEVISGGVLHREESSHLVTPEPDEMPATQPNSLNLEEEMGVDFTPTRLADRFAMPTSSGEIPETLRPAGAGEKEGPAWTEPAQEAPKERRSSVPAMNVDRELRAHKEGEDEHIGNVESKVQEAREEVAREIASFSGREDMGDVDFRSANTSFVASSAGKVVNMRLFAFEEQIRRNRTDITATCDSCSYQRKKAA